MKKKVRTEGTDFTRRRIVEEQTETPEEMAEALHEMVVRLQNPWEQQRPLLKAIRQDLLKEAAAHPPGHQFRPREDAGWYLREMDRHGQIVDDHIAKGDASWAAQHAMLFGELWAEFQLMLARGRLFMVGKSKADTFARTRDEANDRRQMHAAAQWAQWNRAAKDVWARHPTWKTQAVARQVKRDLGLSESVETIRKRLKKPGEAA